MALSARVAWHWKVYAMGLAMPGRMQPIPPPPAAEPRHRSAGLRQTASQRRLAVDRAAANRHHVAKTHHGAGSGGGKKGE